MDAKFSKYRNDSYAQFGEDIVVSRLLREKTGFYVDIGAHHPIKYSTTALLHARGWHGINVDADPSAIEAFNEHRPNDINLHVGVGAVETEMDFHLLGAGKINTFDPNLARQRADRGAHGVIKVKVRPLASILAEHMPPDTEIDYLNIDCEGLDDAVVQSNDWSRWRPRVITVEIRIDLMAPMTSPTVLFLREQGYLLKAYLMNTALFVRRKT